MDNADEWIDAAPTPRPTRAERAAERARLVAAAWALCSARQAQGRPAPSVRELARLLSIPAASTAQAVMRDLLASGYVEATVEPGLAGRTPRALRVVTPLLTAGWRVVGGSDAGD